MSTSAAGSATDQPDRYEPFGDKGYRRTADGRDRDERIAPDAVSPVVFRTGDDDASS
jgi:hypothetical protein